MIYNLEKENSEILFKETVPFSFENPPIDPKELEANLLETMYEHSGIGLSANQCGLPHKVFAIGDPTKKEGECIFNPILVNVGEEAHYFTEGCLSYPNLFVKIKRPSVVRLRFTNSSGDIDTMKYGGLTARVILHEFEHLMGAPYYNKANTIHLERAMKRREKLNRNDRNDKN